MCIVHSWFHGIFAKNIIFELTEPINFTQNQNTNLSNWFHEKNPLITTLFSSRLLSRKFLYNIAQHDKSSWFRDIFEVFLLKSKKIQPFFWRKNCVNYTFHAIDKKSTLLLKDGSKKKILILMGSKLSDTFYSLRILISSCTICTTKICI